MPENCDFRLFIGSDGLNSIIIGHAVKSISGKLFLQEEKLVLRHAAIDEVPHIVLILTEDVRELCDWLGLDYARWLEGFVNEEEHWRWATKTPERSVIWYAWRRLGWKHQHGYNPPFELKTRTVEMVRFYAWLQTTEFGVKNEGATITDSAFLDRSDTHNAAPVAIFNHSTTDDDETTPLLAPPEDVEFPPDVAGSAPIASLLHAQDDFQRVRVRPRYRDFKPPSSVPPGTPAAYITRVADLESEIDKPVRWDLDRGALRALEHWGLRTRYFDVVAVRREERRELLRAQLKNVRAKEEEKKSWRKWLKARLRRVFRVILNFCSKRKVD